MIKKPPNHHRSDRKNRSNRSNRSDGYRRKFQVSGLVLLGWMLCFTCIPISTYASGQTFQPHKDEALAGFLSLALPGLGHFYIGETISGLSFFAAEQCLFWGTILNITDLHIGFRKDLGFEAAFHLKRSPSKARVISTIGLGLSFIGVKIWDILTAINGTQDYNKRIFESRLEKNLAFTPYISPEGALGSTMSLRF